MNDDLRVGPKLTIPGTTIDISHSRSGGPGGQNVNKVNSRVTLRWTPEQCAELPGPWLRRLLSRHANRVNAAGQFVLHSDRYRDQHRNLADVRQRLVTILLECQFPAKTRRATAPTRGSVLRRLDQKQRQGDKKQGRQTPGMGD